MKSYANKEELSRCFGISRATVYKKLKGIEEEIKRGRYNRYAIADGLVSTAVFADYLKYQKRLEDRNLRKTVPSFNKQEAEEYLLELEGKTPSVSGIVEKHMIEEYLQLKEEEENTWKEYAYESRRNASTRMARDAYEEIRQRYIKTALAIADRAAETFQPGRKRRAEA